MLDHSHHPLLSAGVVHSPLVLLVDLIRVKLQGAMGQHGGHVLGHSHHPLLHEGAVQAAKGAYLRLHAYKTVSFDNMITEM